MNNNISKKKYFIKERKGGMTLVELLVVLGIFTIISSLVMFNYGDFKSTTSTQNLANDIALSIRKAQSSAIGVLGVGSVFNYGHGIHFTNITNPSNPISGSNKSFVLFTDLDSQKKYNYNNQNNISDCGNPNIECEEFVSINGEDEISTIYLDGSPQNQGGILDIVFQRPNPDAYFCYRANINATCLSDFSYIQIKVKKGQAGVDLITKMITVWNTGQISVK